MKSDKIMAALFSAVIPFSTSGIFMNSSIVYADIIEEAPDWVPTSFEEAMEFRNTYGAVHIEKNEFENDTVCVVFSEDPDKEYTYERPDTELAEVSHKVFTDEKSHIKYEVVAYMNLGLNVGCCGFSTPLFVGEDLVESYDFEAYSNYTIKEIDDYSWLPDCVTEYEDFIKENGEVSVRDDFVVFCLDSNAGTPCSWEKDDEKFDDSAIDYTYTVYCNEETPEPLDGGAMHQIIAHQLKGEGRVTLTYDLIPMINKPITKDDIMKKLTADCMLLDGGKKIFLPGTVRFTFTDSKTGEKLIYPNKSTKIELAPTIGYKNYKDNVYAFSDISLSIDSNPYIWRNPEKKAPGIFDVELSEESIPDGYTLIDDYNKITRYDNGSYDVEFMLTPDENGLSTNEVRITVYDKDTGELIPQEVLNFHNFCFGTDIRFKEPDVPGGWMMTGPVFPVTENPTIYHDNLPGLYRDADVFGITGEYQPEITYYANNSMDIVFRIKIKVYGDVNGDGGLTVSDILMFKKWLLTGEGNEYARWHDADFCPDGKLDVFDLCIMKKKLIEKNNNFYTDITEQHIKTDEINGHASYTQQAIIKSSDELEKLIAEKKESFDMTDFEKAAEKYDADWFKEHKLIVIAYESCGDDVRYRVNGIHKNMIVKYSEVPNDFVEIECLKPLQYGERISHWHILVEIDSSFDINENFGLNFINPSIDT